MSRVGRKLINIPDGVDLKINDNTIYVSGKLGKSSYTYPEFISCTVNDNNLKVEIDNIKNKANWKFWGLHRSNIANVIIGVSSGFNVVLQINGVGYKASLHGKNYISLFLGFSHEIFFVIPDGISVELKENNINIFSIDKKLAGEVAAKIRGLRPPEPYKGKGIKYLNEIILRKEGKK